MFLSYIQVSLYPHVYTICQIVRKEKEGSSVIYSCVYRWYLVTKLCSILATSWGVAHKTPLSMGFPMQE